MNIGRVEGSVVCSVKTPTLTGVKLLVVRLLANGEPKGLVIASDGTHQAGIIRSQTPANPQDSYCRFLPVGAVGSAYTPRRIYLDKRNGA